MPFASNLDKWNALVAGHNVGPMVSPLCDSWRLDEPYRWPGPGPEPFPPGHPEHSLVPLPNIRSGLIPKDLRFLPGNGLSRRMAAR